MTVFRNIPNRRDVLAWGMFDFANQSFTLLINTLLFSIFLKVVVAPDDATGDRLWGIIAPISLLVVVLLSPVIGAAADARRHKKLFLLISAIFCVIFTCGLSVLQPGWLLIAALVYIPANIAYNIGENLVASFLPLISNKENVGRVSAIGWTMGYIGALCLLILTVAMMLSFGWKDPDKWRPFFIFAGIWFALAAVPTFLILKEDGSFGSSTPVEPLAGNVFVLAHQRLMRSLKHAKDFRQLQVFFVCFFIYGMGVQTVIFFAGILAKDLGFTQIKLVMFVLQLTVTAGVGAVVTGLIQDILGHLRTITLYLVIWVLSTGSLAVLSIYGVQEWQFWVLANGVGLGLGGIGTASRAMVAVFTPESRTGEFFGLWGMVYKLAGVVGVFSFGMVKAATPTIWPALMLLTAFFLVGLIGVQFVNVEAGIDAARRDEDPGSPGTPRGDSRG